MEQEIRAFLNKFIASLCLEGVDAIPFAGSDFQNGMRAVERKLRSKLQEEEYDKISDAFVKIPVEETYQEIRSMFMELNGEGISFSGVDNPQWKNMTIKMTPYLAKRILEDQTVFSISSALVNDATKEFCEAAGVPLWEAY